VTLGGHFSDLLTVVTLYVQMMHDLLPIAKFIVCHRIVSDLYWYFIMKSDILLLIV